MQPIVHDFQIKIMPAVSPVPEQKPAVFDGFFRHIGFVLRPPPPPLP
ncbi:MAG: hypothetical protein MUF86_05290 [Akkermansiaceae bacterium]|nr:hypothetical protein [Akkermansiaceae bacterium]